MDTNAYVTFLVVGMLLIAIDGQVIYHSGKRYLNKGDKDAGRSMASLVAVLFHLAVLGMLALISTIGFPGGSSLPGVIGRLGVLMLVLALAHGITVGVLTRMREEQVVEIVNTRLNAPVDRRLREPVVDPVPGQEGRRPQASPSIDGTMPYTTDG